MSGRHGQMSLFGEAPTGPTSLRDYDWIVVSSSAGKDSQAMLDAVYQRAESENCAERIVVVHCDLGRVEWPGARELAERQALAYGVRFLAVWRRQGDLLTQVEQRGMWPDPKRRYCTSDHKRAQVHRVFTALTTTAGRKWPCRILSCLGMRADESPARAKKPPFQRDAAASNGRRLVDAWLPLHGWSEADIWARIRGSRQADMVHPAYGLGMPRLSCCFCIFAPKAALVLAGRHNPELLAEYVRVEAEIGHTFRQDLSLAEVQRAADSGRTEAVATWQM